MEELGDGLLIYSNNANLVADSFLLDDSWEFCNEGVGGSILGGGNNSYSHSHSLFPDQDGSSSLDTILDSAKCSYIAQPNSDILPFSTLEDAEMGLEWLSAFEESSSGSDGAANSGVSQKKQSHHESKPWPSSYSLSMVIPCRARSKRPRSHVHPYKPRLSTTRDASPASQAQSVEEEEETVKKVKRRGVKGREGSGNGSSGQPRRCTHCQTQKTPQWRQGPVGPKSLCNACGVRFKTGRLLPEYRPAKSPSFVTFLHSNSHKKVLEMRGNDHELGMHALPAPVQFMNHHSYNLC